MSFLAFIQQYGLWVAPPAFLASAASLGLFILKLIRLGDQCLLASLPLIEQQAVQFNEAGRVSLWGEGPRLSRRFARLDYELASSFGQPVEGSRILFHSTSASWSTVRMDLKSFTIPAPGQYTLTIRGLGGEQEEDDQHKILFMRPHRGRTIVYILGVIASAFLMIGSFVLFTLHFLPMEGP